MGVTRAGSFAQKTTRLQKTSAQTVLDLQPSGAQTGLAADSTGVKFTANREFILSPALFDQIVNAYLEVSKASSSGGETTTVQLYNVTSGTVDASLAVSGASQRSRSNDISGSLTVGDTYRVRWNVTSASGTSGATFSANSASLLVNRLRT